MLIRDMGLLALRVGFSKAAALYWVHKGIPAQAEAFSSYTTLLQTSRYARTKYGLTTMALAKHNSGNYVTSLPHAHFAMPHILARIISGASDCA